MEKEKTLQRLGRFLKNAKPYLLMVALQAGGAGQLVISQVTLNHGMSRYVLIVYRNAVAALVMGLFALLLDRKKRPRMTIWIILKIMALAFLETILDQNFLYMGMNMTSASCASAILNAAPVITFVIALVLRMERVEIKKMYGLAKVFGTLVTFGGALSMTLYKGPIIPLFGNTGSSHVSHSTKPADQHKFILGTLFVFIACFSWSSFFVLQSMVVKEYPAELSLAALICVMGTVQSAALTLVVDHRPGVWSIGWDSRLLAPVYTGIVASGVAYYFQGIVMKTRGPVFATAFNPLCMIIVAALSSFVLSEQLHLGSLIGAVIIVVGLYAVLWGKSKDLSAPKIISNECEDEAQELPVTRMDGIKLVNSVNNNGDELGKESEDASLNKIPELNK